MVATLAAGVLLALPLTSPAFVCPVAKSAPPWLEASVPSLDKASSLASFVRQTARAALPASDAAALDKLALRSDDSELAVLGATLVLLGFREEGLYLLATAARARLKDPALWSNLGAALVQQARFRRQGVTALHFAVSWNAASPTALAALGKAAFDEGAYDAAQTFFERALRIQPRFDDARAGLAATAYCQHRPDQARQAIAAIQAPERAQLVERSLFGATEPAPHSGHAGEGPGASPDAGPGPKPRALPEPAAGGGDQPAAGGDLPEEPGTAAHPKRGERGTETLAVGEMIDAVRAFVSPGVPRLGSARGHGVKPDFLHPPPSSADPASQLALRLQLERFVETARSRAHAQRERAGGFTPEPVARVDSLTAWRTATCFDAQAALQRERRRLEALEKSRLASLRRSDSWPLPEPVALSRAQDACRQSEPEARDACRASALHAHCAALRARWSERWGALHGVWSELTTAHYQAADAFFERVTDALHHMLDEAEHRRAVAWARAQVWETVRARGEALYQAVQEIPVGLQHAGPGWCEPGASPALPSEVAELAPLPDGAELETACPAEKRLLLELKAASVAAGCGEVWVRMEGLAPRWRAGRAFPSPLVGWLGPRAAFLKDLLLPSASIRVDAGSREPQGVRVEGAGELAVPARGQQETESTWQVLLAPRML